MQEKKPRGQVINQFYLSLSQKELVFFCLSIYLSFLNGSRRRDLIAERSSLDCGMSSATGNAWDPHGITFLYSFVESLSGFFIMLHIVYIKISVLIIFIIGNTPSEQIFISSQLSYHDFFIIFNLKVAFFDS